METKIKSTKQLAWELGLLRKRSSSVSTSRETKKHKLDTQPFSHLVVMDFESTCWENEKSIPQEIIEFPAVLVNCRSGEIESEFHHFIQPSENPHLSDFCRQLTGISQEQVDDGIPLSVCLRKFLSWLKKLEKERGISYASDKKTSKWQTGQPGHDSKLAAFVTWSDWDLGVCLLYEAKRKQIMKPSALDRWIDLRATYRKFYSRRPDGLNGALNDLGINFDGRQHSGLDDAKNTAKLAYRMICDGCILNITKTLKGDSVPYVERISIPAPIPTGSSCNKTTNVASSTFQQKYNKKFMIVATTNVKSPGGRHKTSYANIKSPGGRHKTSSASVKSPGERHKTSSTNVKSPRGRHKLSEQSGNLPTTPRSSKTCHTVQKPANKCQNQNMSLTATDKNFVLESSMRSSSSCTKSAVIKMACPKGTTTKPKIPVATSLYGDSFSNLSIIKSATSVHQPSKVQSALKMPFKTPSPGEVKPFVRVTPPLCSCGRRSKRRFVQSPGPNTGRWFYSCPISCSSFHGKSKGCTFFKWETPSSGSKMPR